jgi:hypothetical protein
MSAPPVEDERLARLTAICAALPETVCIRLGRHARFLVREKTFAYYLDDHHGDGMVAVSCKVASGTHTMLVAADPDRFYLPAYLGPKGWIGLRLDRGPIDWGEVADLVLESYRLVAPRRLSSTVPTNASNHR